MYSYEELEKIYYKRKYQKIGAVVGISLLFIIGIYLLVSNTQRKDIKSVTNSKKVVASHKEEKVKAVSKKEPPQKSSVTHQNNQMVLSFILPDIEAIDSKKNQKAEKKVSSAKASKVEHKVAEKPAVKRDKPLIVIKSQKLTLGDLIKSYQNFPSFEKAIKIANLYLKKNELKKAKEWALKANNIDASNYESWIIFAKILIKQNKRKEAIKVLKTYVENYGNNSQIENFIRSLK